MIFSNKPIKNRPEVAWRTTITAVVFHDGRAARANNSDVGVYSGAESRRRIDGTRLPSVPRASKARGRLAGHDLHHRHRWR
jgi:hypothetical protein